MGYDDNIPCGAMYDSDAPWNEDTEEIDVCVSITLSKTVALEIPKKMELTEQELVNIVRERCNLPSDNNSDWNVDEITVIQE